MLMLTNANLEHTPLSSIKLRGSLADFTSEWYLQVGENIVKTMVINSLMPFFNIIILLTLKCIPRFLDSGCSMTQEIPKTKKKTIQDYV